MLADSEFEFKIFNSMGLEDQPEASHKGAYSMEKQDVSQSSKQSLEEEVLSWSIDDILIQKSLPFMVMILSQQDRFLFLSDWWLIVSCFVVIGGNDPYGIQNHGGLLKSIL